MSVIPNARQAAEVSSSLGNLQFTPSVDPVLYYEARVVAEGTVSPALVTKYIGVPEPNPTTGLVTINLFTVLNALPPGNYYVVVAAIGVGGESVSGVSNLYDVPLHF